MKEAGRAGAMSERRGEKNRQCVVLSLSILIAATLAFLVNIAFFHDGGGGVLHQWWRCQDGAGTLGQLPTNRAVAAGGGDAPTTLLHIVFGIGSSVRGWNKRHEYVELWWRPGQMRGHVWLDQEPATPWPAATSPPYRVSADMSRYGRRAAASRMARIVVDSFLAVAAERANGTAGADEARWFVMGDDDTVFFPDNLVAALRKYDHRDTYYVGAPSESAEQNALHSYHMAFGGGGFAVSYAAAAELAKVMDGCLDRYRALFGSDERVHACLSEVGIPLTREPGFHQMDIHDDAYGMLAAHPVAPLVSLHHLDHIQPIIPNRGTPLDAVRSLVNASRFDPARTLQQSFCYQHGPDRNWSVSIAWGYTAQLFPWIVAPRELEVPLQTFQSWRTGGSFVFNTRPWRPGSACARPEIFLLSRVRNDETGGATVTEYARHPVQPERRCDMPSFRAASAVQTVSVFAPKMSPDDWKRAPRRHCCKIERTLRGSTLDVRIRRCDGGDFATPTL